VVGTGYVGLVAGACFAEWGNSVNCIDIVEDKIERLKRGLLSIHEPGLQPLLERNRAAGRLFFTTSYHEALEGCDFVFIAVNTPLTPEGSADLSQVYSACQQIGEAVGKVRPIIVIKSTVPVGTGDLMERVLAQANGYHEPMLLVANPEFLRQGSAVDDFMRPSRVIIGSNQRSAAESVAELYQGLDCPVLITKLRDAEMIKYASNAFLATKISFINEVASICEKVGADVCEVSRGMGLDERIGRAFLNAGIGYGGSCLPKDIAALAHMARSHGLDSKLLDAVAQVNLDQRRRVVQRLQDVLGTLEDVTVCIFGLSFKPGTDDIRDAPALDIVRLLRSHGASVRVYDPVAKEEGCNSITEATYCVDPYQAAEGCDALIIATEWSEFKGIDLGRLRALMRRGVFVDGRAVFDPEMVRLAGFSYIGVGRPDEESATGQANSQVGETSTGIIDISVAGGLQGKLRSSPSHHSIEWDGGYSE